MADSPFDRQRRTYEAILRFLERKQSGSSDSAVGGLLTSPPSVETTSAVATPRKTITPDLESHEESAAEDSLGDDEPDRRAG